MPTADIEKQVALLKQQVDGLDRCINGNGKPGLEDRVMGLLRQMRAEIDVSIEKVSRHTEKNFQQSDIDVLAAVERETSERERQHRENKERDDKREEERKEREREEKLERKQIKAGVDRLTMVVSALGLAFAIIEGLEKFGILHFKG